MRGEDRDGNSSDSWSAIINESERRLAAQLEDAREAKSQSARILRIIVAFLAILLTGILGSLRILLSDNIEFDWNAIIPSSETIASSGVTEDQADLLLIYTAGIVIYYVWASLANLSHSISSALSAMEPTEMESGVAIENVNNWADSKARSFDQWKYAESLSNTVAENQEKLEELQGDWEESHSSLVKSIVSLVFATVGWGVTAVGHYAIVLLFIGAIALKWTISIRDIVNRDTLIEVTKIRPQLDIPLLVGIFALFLPTYGVVDTQSTWLMGITGIILISMIGYSILASISIFDTRDCIFYLYRNSGTFLISFFAFPYFLYGLESTLFLGDKAPLTSLTFSVVVMSIAMCLVQVIAGVTIGILNQVKEYGAGMGIPFSMMGIWVILSGKHILQGTFGAVITSIGVLILSAAIASGALIYRQTRELFPENESE